MKSITLKSTRSGLRNAALMAAVFMCFTLPATAQNAAETKAASNDLMPAMTSSNTKEYTADGEETHPPIRISPDKTEMVRLDEDASSIIVSNPAHANIMLDSPRLILLVPRTPGATQFTVINGAGKVIMQRHVVVAGPNENYVRVRRTCNITNPRGCQPTSVYYCPSGTICSDIQLGAGQGNNTNMVNSISSAGTPQGEETVDPDAADAELDEDDDDQDAPILTNEQENELEDLQNNGGGTSSSPSRDR